MDVTWIIRGTFALAVAVGIGGLPVARAQSVQKCQDRSGQVRYQSAPCAQGERTLERWEAVPDPEPVRRASSEAQRAPRSRRAAARPPRIRLAAATRSEQSVDSCAAAKAYRDAVERRVGLARTYELLSALSRQVYDACK
ncbi:hypothetical protein [Lysobacter humi (ex Lee et al. 2017)]